MLTEEEFRLFRTLIYQESGMFLKDARKEFLESKLIKRMKATNVSTAYWYYRFLQDNRQQELLKLLDSLTINETSFFRNAPQFDLFRNTILPDLIRRTGARSPKTLKIWSAGSSTGEEPYSIAMTVLDTVLFPDQWEIRIFASDISMKSLETAHRGFYPAVRVLETVPQAAIERYFEPHQDGFRVRDAVRRLVVFDYHNLKHENGLCGLDAVFCRNVMIYFDEVAQRLLVRKFERCLNPGGYLLIGHAETLQGLNMNFRFIHQDGGTAYQKPEPERELQHEDPDRRG